MVMGIKLILTVIVVLGLSRPAGLNAEPVPSEQQQLSVRKEYGHLLVENLEKLKRYPTVLRGTHAEGTVLVSFTVDREGKITETKVKEGQSAT
jgi:outer membrane biosynthesis protein TonB